MSKFSDIINFATSVKWESFNNAYPNYNIPQLIFSFPSLNEKEILSNIDILLNKMFHQSIYYNILEPGIDLLNFILECNELSFCRNTILSFYSNISSITFYKKYGLLAIPLPVESLEVTKIEMIVYEKINKECKFIYSLLDKENAYIILELLSYYKSTSEMNLNSIANNSEIQEKLKISFFLIINTFCEGDKYKLEYKSNDSFVYFHELYKSKILSNEQIECVEYLLHTCDPDFPWIGGYLGAFVADIMMKKINIEQIPILLDVLFIFIKSEKMEQDEIMQNKLNLNTLIKNNPSLSFAEIIDLLEQERKNVEYQYPVKWKIILEHIIMYFIVLQKNSKVTNIINNFLATNNIQLDLQNDI